MATRIVTTPLDKKAPWLERIYLAEVLRGLSITITHFIKNIADLRKNKVGATYQWPEEHKPLADTWRGEHRLMLREDGTPRCVACNCCATACPADCIDITGADTGKEPVEKYPIEFDIDVLQCIYCGMCVEACPCDAIRMDTGKFTSSYYDGPVKILDIDYLLNNHPEGANKVSEAIY